MIDCIRLNPNRTHFIKQPPLRMPKPPKLRERGNNRLIALRTKATIQLDKLIFFCSSSIDNNFDYQVRTNSEYTKKKEIRIDDIYLLKIGGRDRYYRYSYRVFEGSNLVGVIDFGQNIGNSINNHLIRFSVDNKLFYTDNLNRLPFVLEKLCLVINNFNKIEIALDYQDYNIEDVLRKALRNKNHEVKLLGKIIRDRDKHIDEILYMNSGSLNLPMRERTIYIDNKKKTFGLSSYNKTAEIAKSNKGYIIDYHRKLDPAVKEIYRLEIRLAYEQIRRHIEKYANISIQDLLTPTFLYHLLAQYLDRIVMIRKGKGNKKVKLSIVPDIKNIINIK